MRAEERHHMPVATRRALLTAALAAPVLAVPLAAKAAAGPDLNARYEQMVADYNALPIHTPEDADDDAFEDINSLDDNLAQRACLTGRDARAKVGHAIRGFEEGTRGTEVDALRQVMAFLERA